LATTVPAAAQDIEDPTATVEITDTTYLEALITTDEAIEVQKSNIFDASQSFIPDPTREVTYHWDFGDGNKNEGVEVLHAYKEPGNYTINLTVNDGIDESNYTTDVFVYRKLLILISDEESVKERIEIIQDFSEKKGVFIKILESFGSSTEFISEEVLSKKMTEQTSSLQKSSHIIIWTKENAGLNALSRFVQANQEQDTVQFNQKTITVLGESLGSLTGRIQRQFEVIQPKEMIVAKEAAIYPLIESYTEEEFIETLEKGGYEYVKITDETGKIKPWNFMSYFVNFLINNGIPDNTIALLLLLPVIATVVAFMKQFIGMTTFGIYTPTIITLSFLTIGIYAGLLTLFAAILIGALTRPLLKKVRMLYIPKMAIVLTLVALMLFLLLIISTYIHLFDAQFLSIAIFPMLILSTLVEKFISVKTEKGLLTATILMMSTVLVSIIAYIVAGGEINLGLGVLRFTWIKGLVLSYPEIIILLLFVNVLLGKWSGLRVLERVRFREVLRHIEE